MTIREASDLVRKKKVSPVELTQACLVRIDRANPTLNCFITVPADSALQQAHDAESEIMRGKWRGPLHGIPIALKDLFDTAGVKTTAGSGVFKDRVPTEDAEVVRRLKEAGSILLGKTNMQEFAYGGSSIVSYFGAVHHSKGQPPKPQQNHLMSHLRYGLAPTDSAGVGQSSLRTSSGIALRHCRLEADVWAGEHSRGNPSFLVARPRRSHGAYCG